MGFSEQLKQARLAQGLTQRQVAELMGIETSTYCGYETGKRKPDVEKIKRLATILNTSGDALLETQLTYNENSSKQKELLTIFDQLNPALQGYLIKTANELLDTQLKMQFPKE